MGKNDFYRNGEGYTDKTAGKAIERELKRETQGAEPENVVNFRKGIRLLCQICKVRVQGKITVVDEKGRRW